MSNFEQFASLDHPILEEFDRVAPGSFGHSVSVGEISHDVMVEVNDEFGIGDPVLARAGGYFHDLGKMSNPDIFAENEAEGEMAREEKIRLILNHPEEGVRIAREHGVPEEIIRFMLSHHGTSKAFEASDIGNGDSYRYDGVKPVSVEEVVVMLADYLDASVTRDISKDPSTLNYLDLVTWIREHKEDQLDEIDFSGEILDRICAVLAVVAEARYAVRASVEVA